jgi:integrase
LHSLTKDELRALLGKAKAESERDWLMILVTFQHGLRASETTGFTADAVQDGFFTIQRLKKSKKTTHPLGGRRGSALRRAKSAD